MAVSIAISRYRNGLVSTHRGQSRHDILDRKLRTVHITQWNNCNTIMSATPATMVFSRYIMNITVIS